MLWNPKGGESVSVKFEKEALTGGFLFEILETQAELENAELRKKILT